MARTPLRLTDSELPVVAAERYSHPDTHVRRKMFVLWSVHKGITQAKAGEVAGVCRATVCRYLEAYRAGGLDGLREWDVVGPVSELAGHAATIKASLELSPVRTVAEAADRIRQLTGLERGLTQTRVFLTGLGFQWQRTRALPVPPKSPWPSMSPRNGIS